MIRKGIIKPSSMLISILIVVASAAVLGMLASVVMSWASNRSALFNMILGAVLALAVLAGALTIALFMTRAMYPS
jgi:uncharacterized membrane protein YeaQ/YmgE (transglycosylase-associated protein family)